MKKTVPLIALLALSTAAIAQIPNGSFENWSGNPPVVDNWELLSGKANQYTSTSPKTASVTVNGTPTNFNFAPTQGSKNIGIQSDTTGVGITATFWGQVRNVFPSTARPNGAQLYAAYLSKSTLETFGAWFLMTKWNGTSRDTIFQQLCYINQGGPLLNVSNVNNPWMIFTFNFLPANYLSSNSPDTMTIVLSSSSTTQKTVDAELLVDNILLSSFGTGSPQLMPVDYTPMSVYPNPMQHHTTLNYQVPAEANVRLIVTDMNGRLVNEVVNENKAAGRYTASFDSSHLKPRLYICQLQAGELRETSKLIIAR